MRKRAKIAAAHHTMHRLRRNELIKTVSLSVGIILLWSAILIRIASSTDIAGVDTIYVTGTLSAGSLSYRGSDGGLPSGSILLFKVSCPSGWTRISAADSRYIRFSTTAGSTGGGSTHSHTFSHSHGEAFSDVADGSHSHDFTSETLSTNTAHAHSGSGSSYAYRYDGSYGFWYVGDCCTDSQDAHSHTFSGTTSTDGSHSDHTLSGTSGATSPTIDTINHGPLYISTVLCKKG